MSPRSCGGQQVIRPARSAAGGHLELLCSRRDQIVFLARGAPHRGAPAMRRCCTATKRAVQRARGEDAWTNPAAIMPGPHAPVLARHDARPCNRPKRKVLYARQPTPWQAEDSTESAICSDCNEVVAICWWQSVTVTCRRPIRGQAAPDPWPGSNRNSAMLYDSASSAPASSSSCCRTRAAFVDVDSPMTRRPVNVVHSRANSPTVWDFPAPTGAMSAVVMVSAVSICTTASRCSGIERHNSRHGESPPLD